MKKSILLLFLSLMLSSDSSAQFSVKGGINLAKISSVSPFGSSSGRNKVGVLFGINYNHHLSEFFSLRPGIQYSSKGNELVFGPMNFSSSRGYLEAPIDIVYTIGNVSVHGGPYFAYLLTATAPDQNIKELINPFDFGFDFGLAVSYKNIGLGINNSLGLRNTDKNAGEDSFLNIVTNFYLTYTH